MSVIRKIVLGNGTEFNIENNISENELMYKGLYTKGISLTIVGSDLSTVHTAFSNSSNLNTINEMDDAGTTVINKYDSFTDMYSVNINYEDGEDKYAVTLARPVDYQRDINDLKAKQDLIAATVDTLTAEPDPTKMELADAIEYLSNDSKKQLSAYLETHPITSSAHGTAAKYSITRDKQNLLTSMILMTQMAKQNGLDYTPSWNATNEPCTYDWTVKQLQDLAVQIEVTVRPLISLQQTIESNIRKATTVEDAIKAAVKFEDAVAAKNSQE